MKIINGEAARKRMAHHLTECEETGEALCIVTQKPGREPQQMIVMSKVNYDELINIKPIAAGLSATDRKELIDNLENPDFNFRVSRVYFK